jgi:hypothetical protein
MKTLAEFDTLEAAKEYPQSRGKMIHRDTMNFLLAKHSRYKRLKEIANDQLNPLSELVDAFMDSTEYNLIQSSVTGQGVIGLMQQLIASEGNDENLQSVLNAAIATANEVYYPYANATEHAFLKAKGTCPTKQVTPIGGYLKITLTQDVEAHRPSVYAMIDGVNTYITTFSEVGAAKSYICQVPRGYIELYVDNAYGALA